MPDIFDTVADKVSAPDIFDRVGSAPPEQPAYFPAPEPGAPQLPVPTAEDLKKYGGGEALEDPTLPNITSSGGKSITAAGRVLAAEGEDVAEQVANRVKGYKSLEPAWRNTMALDPFNIGEEGMPPTPYERDLEEQKGVTKLAGDLSTGIVKTLPQMYLGGEIAGPFKALGFSERAAQMVGMGTAFGFDEKGFDAKQAALMAAFPLAADYGGKIVETTLGKIGVKPESELARQAVKWVGSLAGSQAYMDATQLPEYTDPRLTPEQKRELFVNNLAQNIAFHLVQIPGMKGQADAVNKATREAAEDYADGFWKAQTEKQPDASEEFQKALSKVYPAQAAPPISEINNRIRQTLKPVPQVNRLRVPLPAQPQPETPNATRTLVQQESGQPQHQGTPQGENLQPNAPQEGQEIGGQTGGGNRPVGAAPKPNAEVGPPPADDAGRLQWLKALPSPTPEQITERDALQAKSNAVRAKMAAEFEKLKEAQKRPFTAASIKTMNEWFAKLKAAQKPPLAPNQTEISPDQAKAISGGRPNLMPKSGETKPQLQDTTGEYFIGQTADGRFFTEHRPKPPVKQPAKPAETPSVETPIDKNPTETESAANAGKSNIPPAPTSGIPVREPPGTRPPVAPAGPVAPSVGGEGAGGVAGGGGNVEGGDVPGSGPRGSEQPDIGSTGRTGDNARPGTRPPAVEGAGGGAPQSELNHVLPKDTDWIPEGAKAKARANLDAIRLVKKLETENRNPTPEEKQVLEKYVGWGGLKQVFDEGKAAYRDRPPYYEEQQKEFKNWEKQWGQLYDAVKGELSEDEWDRAARSVLNAHYTSREVINGVWKAAERLGFKGGNVLEAGAGVGNFIGLTPENVRNKTRWTAVEIDSISSRILAKLYPQATVHQIGFEKASIPANSQDMMIGNIPFAADGPSDSRYPNFSLHNYFLARGMDLLKPGGLMAVITSDSTMDNAVSRKARQYLAERADLVGAMRLPNNAFEKNAGTEVTTDVLFFRKRDGTPFEGHSFTDTDTAETYKGEPVSINRYYIDHPEMLLGKLSKEGTMYGTGEKQALLPIPGKELPRQMDEAIAKLPANIMGASVTPEQMAEPVAARAEKGAKVGGLVVQEGKVKQVEPGGILSDPEWSANAQKVAQAKRYIAVRDVAKDYIRQMLDPETTDAQLAHERERLNNAYDHYASKHGALNSRSSRFLDDDVDYPLAMALEDERIKTIKEGGVEKKSVEYVKSKLFNERTIFPRLAPDHVDTVSDATGVSLNYTGKVDPDYIARLTGKTPESVKNALRDDGLAFENPETGLWESRATYLSGFVKEKLARARALLSDNPTYAANVRELEKVQPARIPIQQISVKLGATWVPPEIIERFIRDALQVGTQVHFTPETGTWRVAATSGQFAERNTSTFGIHGWKGHEIIEAALNLKQPVVTRTESYINEAGKSTTREVRDPAKTAEASAKQDQLQRAWQEWSKTTPDVAKQLEDIYNEYFNGVVAPKFDGPSWVHYPGASTDVTLREHQKEVASRMIQNSTLLAHAVGTGKTYAMITAAQEMKRMGLARKPMIVVQNATLEQFARSYKKLYPTAKILVPGSLDRDATRRNKTMSRIATGDWDAVIIPQSFVNMLPDDPKREIGYIMEQLAELTQAMIRAKLESGRRAPKTGDIQRAKQRLEDRLAELMDRKKDNVLTFEQLGVDALFVDEAHAYKKLEFATQMDNIKGLDKGASQRAFSMFMKVRWVQEHNQGRNVTFATGTPVSNTLAEAWNMMRFVRPDVLKKYHMEKFDDFASIFGDRVTNMEMTAGGTWKPVTRFAKFTNGPELISAWRTVADVVMPEKLNLPGVPRLKNGKPTAVVVKQSPRLKSYVEKLRGMLEAFDAMSGKEKRENSHIPLVVFGLAKKASLDMRMIDPALSDEPGSKLNVAADEALRIYRESTPVKGTQMIFADIYQNNPDNPGFNVYHEMRDKLIERGIPAEQIAIVTPELKDAKREALFKKVNDGEIRIIMGSSERMGVGVNAQEHLIGLHHLDAPHRPMDIEQRTGRMLRQGNQNPEVEELRYGVENTLDAALFQKLATKQKFINQILRGDVTGRDFDDAANEQSLSFEEQMAAFSGDKRTVEKFALENQLRQLEGLRQGHFRQILDAKEKLNNIQNRDLPSARHTLDSENKRAAELAAAFPADKEPVLEMAGKVATGRKDVVPKLESLAKELIAEAKNAIAGRTDMTKPPQSREVRLKINGQELKLRGEVPVKWDTGSARPEDAFVNWSFAGSIHEQAITTGHGLLTSLHAAVQNIMREPGFTEERIKNYNRDIKELSGFVQQPFDQEAQLNSTRSRLDALNAELAAEAKKRQSPEPPAEAPQAQLGGEQPRNVRETTALGLDQIRAALSDPRLGYDARTVQTALKFLDEPVMRKLDWSKLLLAIRQKLEGNARGAAWLSDNLIEMSGAANPTTFPHEIFHFLYEMLPADYKAAIDGLRIDELRKQFGDNIPPELEAGRMTSDAFQASGLSGDLYPLSNAGEFLANFAGERYAREAFEGRHEPAGFWDKFKADLKSWVTAIVNTVKRTLKVRPDMNRVYDELLSGRWVPTPDSGRAYDDRHAQLALTREQYEKQRAFGEQGTPERTMAAFGDVAEMKRKAAEDISAGDRALKLTRTTNQELLTQLASSDMASPRLAFGNYDAMRARTEGSDQGLRSGVIIDALRGMTYEQHRMAALRVKLAEQEALVSGKRFQDMLKNYWGRRAEAETAEEVRKTFENQIGVETGLVVRELNQRGKTDAQYEQLRSDLARLEKLPEFTEAVSRRVDDIVRTVLASEGGERLLSGLGSKNGTEIFNAYLDLKQQRPTRPQGAGLLGMVDPELLSPRDLAKVEAANRAREMAEQEARLTGDQRVFAQLASAVLAANSELRMKLLSLEYARMHPEFQAKITEVGERFKKAFEQDPGNAVKQVVKLAGSLKAREMDAEAAWLRLNKAVSREVEKLHTLQEAVEIDNRTVASPEWKQLVNRILADNSKLSPAFRVPDSELPHVTGENVWNEFSGKQQFRSPNGGVYDIDLGYTAKSVGEAQSQMQMYLGDLAEWLNDPKNADSPDRAYWSNRYDFVENALNVSTVTKPAAIYGLLGARTPWGMQQYLFESTTLPAARIAGIALNNWKQAWAIQDQWFQDTAELRTRLAQAARSHGLNPDMDMQLYREQILDRLASEYRHGNALKAGDNLNNGVKLTFQDIAAFKLQGQKIAELFNANRNIAREKVMQDGLLMDDFLKNVFAVRAPQELGALPGTTLPHEFSERGKALARQVAAISPGDAFHLKMLFDEPHVFDQFVQRFIAERRADYSTLTPFEDLYKQIAAKWRAGDADAPRNIDEIVDYIEANTPEAVSREVIEKTVLGEMESQLRKFHREFVAKEAPSDTRANRASKSTEFTKGFQREVGSSFFYDYGAVNAREIRSIGLDSMNFHLVRYVRALDSALEAYREAMAKYDNLTGQKAKTALIKATRADFKSGKDFRDFEQLQDEMRSIARLKDQIPKAYGSEQIMSADLFGKMGRFTGDAVSAALSGPLTVGKVYVGSVTKMGLVLGQMERWYAAAYLKGLISTVMSTVEMGGRYYDEFHPAKAPGRVMRVLRDAKLDGLKIALARELQAATEGFFQAGKFFNQQYQFGMGFKSPAGFRAINILEQPFSHGGYYDPKFSQKAWLRLPQKAFYRALSVAEAPLEILKSIYPQIGYAISYDAAARAAGWTVDAIGSQARRSFEFLERTGGLSQYNLDNPRDPKNILPANYVLPRGIWPKGETNLYQARNLWERSIDMPLNEMVLNYWKRLAATPKAERGNVSFLASDVADPVKAKHVEEVRAAALMKAVVEDVHHATVANRPIQFRLDSTWRFIFPMLGWPTQTLRGTLQSLGKAPTDSRGRMLLAAASATTVLAAFAMAALTGETEKGLKKETSEQVNGEIYPEPMVWQAKGAAEAAKLLAIDSVAVIPYAHNLASELLGESSQTVNETGMSVFTLQKFGSIMRYLKGVIATHDATYGLPQLAKSLLPFGRSLINRLDSQTGLVELKNARTVVQKNGPKDLLGEQKPMEYPTPTELSPFKQQLSNAVFQGDQQAVTQAAGAFIAKAVDLGKTPEEAKALLRQAMASFDPVAIAGRKMTDAQYQQTLDNSSTGEAAVLARAANNWNNANAALGLSVPLTKGERGLSGGGGGGAIAVAAAPKNRLRRVSNRLRAPHRASAKIGRARIHIKKLRAPVSRFRKPRNRLRQRKVQTYF